MIVYVALWTLNAALAFAYWYAKRRARYYRGEVAVAEAENIVLDAQLAIIREEAQDEDAQ